jgi:DHA2 family multidrug resistance protein-like MFS transporter
MIIGFILAPALAHRVRAAYVCAGGLALAAIGLLLHTQVESVGGLGLLVTDSLSPRSASRCRWR